MHRLHELDKNEGQKDQLDYLKTPVQKKKMLGLNDSRENDFDF